MRVRVGVADLRAMVAALANFGRGVAFVHFDRLHFAATEGGLVQLTYTTKVGTAFLSCDAEVGAPGECSIELAPLGKFLSPHRGKGWELELRFEPDPRTEGRFVYVGQFLQDGCPRDRFEWPYADAGRQGMFAAADQVAEPQLPSGVVRTFSVPRPRLLSLLAAGGAAHSAVEQGVSQLHSAGLVVAGDVAAVYTACAVWAIRAELWADGELGFDTGWAGEPTSVALSAEGLSKAQAVVAAFGGVEPWLIQVPESGPVRLCPAGGEEDAWVTVQVAGDPLAVPEMLDQLRAAKPGGPVQKVTGRVPLSRRSAFGLRSLVTELELLQAYRAADEEADCWTLTFEPGGLAIDVLSPTHLGAAILWPWGDSQPPNGAVQLSVSGKRLLAAVKALTLSSDPDAEVELTFWADSSSDLERLLLSTRSSKGEAADAVLMPMSRSGGPARLKDYANQTSKKEAVPA